MIDSWEKEPLGELVSIQKGKISEQSEYALDGFAPIINTDALRGDIKVWGRKKGSVTCESDNVLILWDGERSGLCAIGYNGVVGSTFAKMTVSKELEPQYLYRFIDFNFSWIQNQRTGTGVPHVPKDLNKILLVKYPPLPQQQKIAKILSTVDTVIEQTETAITKYQAIKQGLMHDLFTRGIDINTGKLRPTPQDAPHLYKDSALGLIPKEWEVDQLNDMVKDVLDFKASGSFETLTANVKYYYEFKYARLIRLTDLRHDLSKDGVYLDKKGFNFLKKSQLIEGDILIACVGEYTGYVCRMPSVNYPAIIAPNMFLIRFDEKYNNFFINYSMNTDTFQRQIAAVSTSSATKLLNNPNLRSLKLGYPERIEQNLIAAKLESVNSKIQTEQQALAKYQQLKAGLLQDLLTGEVDVGVD
jgi:type I restriction enzyme, S subunit